MVRAMMSIFHREVFMELILLENGVKMPQLGLGVWQSGADTASAVKWALEAGYRHIDTAARYGNEEEVARGIRESGVPREDIFITTKLWTDDVRKGRAKAALMESLKRLDTDYADLYLIHWPANGYQQAWKDLTEMYHEGWCRAIGVANFEKDHLESIKGISDMHPLVNQVESHPYFSNRDIIAYSKSQHIVPEAYSPLGRGKGILEDETVVKIARKYGRTPAQVVLRWQVQNGIIVIPKSVHKERIEENMQIFDFKLRRKDMEAIDSLNRDEKIGADPHTFTF